MMGRPRGIVIDRSEAERVLRAAGFAGRVSLAARDPDNPLPFSPRTYSRGRWSERSLLDFVHWAEIEGVPTTAEALSRSECSAPDALLRAFFSFQESGRIPNDAIEPWIVPDAIFRCEGAGAGIPFAGTYVGIKGLERYLARLRTTMRTRKDPSCRIEVNVRQGYVSMGGRVCVTCDARAEPLKLEFESHWEIGDDLRVRSYHNFLAVDQLRHYLRL